MAVSDGDTVTVVKDMGLVATVFDERTLSGLQGHLAIGHTRYSTHGASDWAGAQPVYRPGRPGRLRPRAQRQPDQHRRAGREGRHAARLHRHRQRRGRRAAGHARSPRPRTWRRALQAVLPIVEGAFSFVLMNSRAPLRRARPATASAPCASGGSARPRRPRAGSWPRRRRPSSVIGATFVREVEPGRAGGHRRRRPAQPRGPLAARGRAPALHLRVRLHRPARQPALRPRGARDPLPHGRAAGRPGPGRGRHGDGGARVGRARRPRASPGPAASPTARGWSRTATSAAPSSRPTSRRGPTRCGASSTRCATPSPASAWSWWTTPSCAARRSARSSRCCARPGRPRCTCASRRRPGAGPASTGSTRPSHDELLAADHSVDEMAAHPRGRLAGLHQHREPQGGHRGRRRLLRRLLHRRLPDARARAASTPVAIGRPEPVASAHQAALPGV